MPDYNDQGDYTEIVCASGETFSKTLSDGETWENILLDITASGASFTINSSGASNWTIRNFGIRGQIDSSGAPSSQNFVVYDPDPNGQSVIENVYHPGTSYSRGNPENFPSGIFVYNGHAGDLEINNFYAVDLPSHALYGSSPGNPSTGGQGGTVRVHDSYGSDTENSGFRIGTDGSYIENCVSFRTVRGLWSRWEDTEARNCDLGDNGTDIVIGDASYAKASTVTVDNTRYEEYVESNGTLYGSTAGTPQEYVPNGCPTSAEEAASGSGGGGGGGGGGTDHTWGEGMDVADSNYLEPTGGNQTGSIAVRDGMTVAAGHTYEVEFEIGPNATPDLGIAFGAQSMDWGNYSGVTDTNFSSYFLFSDGTESRLDRWDSGEQARSTTGAPFPTGEPLRATIDYRDSGSAIEVTIEGASSGQVETLTLTDETVYDEGQLGIYHYYNEPYRIYSLRDPDADPGGPSDPQGIDEYRIYFDGILDQELSPDTTSATIGGLSAGENVTLGVTAVRDGVESEPVELDASTVPDSTVDVTVDAPASVEYGETATFEATVTNTTDQDRDIDIDLYFDAARIPAPQSVDVTSITADEITFEWTFDEANESEIDSFATYVNGAEADSYAPDVREGTGRNLEPGTDYEIAVRAVANGQRSHPAETAATTDTADEGSDPSPTDATIAFDYDGAYDPGRTYGGLETLYDSVADDREGGTAGMTDSGPSGTVSDAVEAHTISAGHSGGTAKSANALVDFSERGFNLPQEVYAEVDILIPSGFDMGEFDTWRCYWNMNRYSGNQYDSTTGNGFSNALGFSDRDNPSGDYRFFSYSYDSEGASNFQLAYDGGAGQINEGEWWTLGMYCRCNDIGSSNAVQKYYKDGTLMQRRDGFQTSANQNAWNHEWGPLAYYIDNGNSSSPSQNRTVYYDRHRFWVDDDIPSEIRE